MITLLPNSALIFVLAGTFLLFMYHYLLGEE